MLEKQIMNGKQEPKVKEGFSKNGEVDTYLMY